MKNQFNVWRIVRFLIVGSINASLSLGVYYLALHFMGLPYYAASALSVIFGVVVGFQGAWSICISKRRQLFPLHRNLVFYLSSEYSSDMVNQAYDW